MGLNDEVIEIQCLLCSGVLNGDRGLILLKLEYRAIKCRVREMKIIGNSKDINFIVR